MAEPVPITDPADPRIGDYVGLTDADLRRGIEGGRGLFIVEGPLAIERLLSSTYRARSFLFTPTTFARLGSRAAATGADVFVADPSVMRSVVGFDLHRGAVASVTRPAPRDPETVLVDASLLLIVEGVNDHENLGALFRNAAAFGVDGVLLDPTCADPLYRRSVRVSMGHVLALPFARLAPWPDALRDLGQRGIAVVALTPDPAVDPLDACAALTPPRAILVGAEGPGLTAGALAAAGRQARIPLAPTVDSLNVATAAAIALHRVATAFS